MAVDEIKTIEKSVLQNEQVRWGSVVQLSGTTGRHMQGIWKASLN